MEHDDQLSDICMDLTKLFQASVSVIYSRRSGGAPLTRSTLFSPKSKKVDRWINFLELVKILCYPVFLDFNEFTYVC